MFRLKRRLGKSASRSKQKIQSMFLRRSMSNNIYPYVVVNHLAMMLIMLKHRFFFPKQAEQLFHAPIHVINPKQSSVNTEPVAWYVYDSDRRAPITI